MKALSKLMLTALTLAVFNAGAMTAVLAQRQYRDTDNNIRNLISRIENRTDNLSRDVTAALNRNRRNGTSRQDEINRLISDFQYSVSQLRSRFDNRQSTASDVREVLNRASMINRFLTNNRLDSTVNQDWQLLQSDLDQLARAYYINDWRWNDGGIGSGIPTDTGYGYGISDAQLRQLVRRIQNETNLFSRSFDVDLNRVRGNTWERDEARRHLTEFENGVSRLTNRFNSADAATVQSALDHAAYLNSFLGSHSISSRAQSDWNTLRSDLDQLASAYNVATNWSTNPNPSGPVYGGQYGQLTGTYRLNSSQTGDPRVAVDNATRNLPPSQRQRVSDSLMRRLDAPESLAIDQRGNNVTIASSRAPQINFVADGREQVETNQNGRTVRVRASMSGNQLTISRTGERAQDFTVTFTPSDNGRRLVVTRTLDSDQLNQPVRVTSYYDRTSDVAQLDLYNGTDYPNTGNVSGGFIIPSGTEIVANLDTNISTSTVRDNDRFTMTVRAPDEYRGARIEGYVTNVNRSGRVTGRSEMTLNFDTIRMADGRTYPFAGILETVRTPGNDSVRVDNEGAVRDSDQTNKTVTRTAVGSAVGAIIGAIAGGGKGAAIGAAIGAGAGAGSVYVQGRDDLDLPTGTEVTIRATGPR